MRFIEKAWHRNSPWLILLKPLSIVFGWLASRRRHRLEATQSPLRIPTIVIGNISVGGTGKTPVVLALVEALKTAGYKPAVVSRGYGGSSKIYPLVVDSQTPIQQSGDEAGLIAVSSDVPVVVDPDRARGVEHLKAHFDCNVVISDDGLQHYSMPRIIEVAVVDSQRAFGNGNLLPAGPLREPISRLKEVDFVLVNGLISDTLSNSGSILGVEESLRQAMEITLEAGFLVNQVTGERKPFLGAPFTMGATIHGVTGIGNPDRFFNLLAELPYPVSKHIFPDHHPFVESDLLSINADGKQPIVMTAKDAIKCTEFADKNYWTLEAKVRLPESFIKSITDLLVKAKL